jgi:hypothetical protein
MSVKMGRKWGKFVMVKENPEPRSVSHPRDLMSPPAPEFPFLLISIHGVYVNTGTLQETSRHTGHTQAWGKEASPL